MLVESFQFTPVPNTNNEFSIALSDSPHLTGKIFSETDNSYSLYDCGINENIGVGEFRADYIFVAIYRKETDTKFSGQQIFKILYDFFPFFYGKSPLGIEVSWGFFSDNTPEFNKFVLNVPIEDAAFKTWTGQRAAERGFNKATILKMEFNNKGKGIMENSLKYAPVSVKFFNQKQ